ncbi:MAG: vitamin K epoxide reductase family protein [Runella sp.]
MIKDSGGILATKIQKVCNFIKEINCDNVTNSRAGALFNEVKVSELGLIYFIGGSLVIASGSTGGLVLLYYFNLLILPYAVYMLFYQAFMIKQWCIFCLIINAIIWLTAALEYLYINYKNISFDNPLLFFFAFVVSTTLWLMIRPQIISSSKEYKTRLEIARFKSNPFIFQKLLENQPVVNIPTFSKEVMLGFSDALHQIVFVSNPHCPPCKEAFNEILKLKGMYENNIKVTFRFMGDISNPNHEINKVAQILISLADSPLLEKALDEWFRYKDFKTWSMKYHQGISSAIKSIHQQHLEWCEIAQVEYTPSIFINGRLLPDFYETEDLLAHFENILILHQVEV